MSGKERRGFLRDGGEAGRLLRATDWAATPLGPAEVWPQPLKTLVNVMIAAKQPMFVAWGAQRTLLYNDSYIPLLGQKHPDALGRSFLAVWSEAQDILVPLVDRVFAGTPVHMDDIELMLDRGSDLQEAHFAFSYTPVIDEAGLVAGLFCPCTETTAQVMAERRHTAERELLWQHSQDLLTILDWRGQVRAVSPAAAKIVGWTPQELIGQSLFDFIHPEDQTCSKDALAHAQASEIPPYESRFRHRDGSYRWLSWVGTPSGELIYASGRHVTVEKEQAEALRLAEDALRQAQKMESVGQLTGGLAHDFNNLLTGITGSLELLELRITQGRTQELSRYLAAAQGASRRAAALTHRLLAFSRRQTLDPRPTDVNRLIAGMEELIRRTVGPAIGMEVVGHGGLWPALIDPNQLESALLSLCINARDAMPDGGRITIETANKWLDDRGARARELVPGQYLCVSVTDTGTGMTPEVIGRAFDPFFTTKPMGHGTGLGLSMIYGFVKQSGGQIRIYSEVNQGTTVSLYLPRYRGPVHAAEEVEAQAIFNAEQGESVLIVDDEPTVRMLVTEVLEDLGYAAHEAADGAAGLRILESGRRIDLLVTDVGLPGGMNGRQVADAGRVLRPGLKVLFITGYAENAVVGNGHLEPGMHLLTKPFSMDELARRIRDALGP